LISSELKNIILLVDGLNLFHGLLSSYGLAHTEVNLVKLSDSIIETNEKIYSIHLFGANFKGNSEKSIAQRKFMLQNSRLENVKTTLGKLKKREFTCNFCKHKYTFYQEKFTDVNIVLKIIEIIQNLEISKIYLISGDNDFLPIVKKVKELNSVKIKIVIPPGIKHVATSSNLYLTKSQILKSKF
jgi:uncharacterized LabA/DUF88 family protein